MSTVNEITPAGELPITAKNSSFSNQLPGLQTAVDSTSLGEFKTCPRKYYYSIIQGWQPRETSVHLIFGLHLHHAREVYEHCKMAGAGHEEALQRVTREILLKTWDKELGRPWLSDHKYKNRLTLIRSVVWYLDHFGKNDPLETLRLANGKPAVELSFRFDSGYATQTTGEPIQFCGHLDRVAAFNDEPVIADIKTTTHTLDGRFFAQFSPGNQFSMYTLAGRVAFGFPIRQLIVDGVQVAIGFSRFMRQPVERPDAVLEEWHGATGKWLRQMEVCAYEGGQELRETAWPQNDKACLTGDTIVTITRGKRKGWKLSISALHEMLCNRKNRFDENLNTYALAEVNGNVRNLRLFDVLPQGRKEVFEIVAENGAKVKATADHKFNTPNGWKTVAELSAGDVVNFWNNRKAGPKKKQSYRKQLTQLHCYPFGNKQRVSVLTVEAAMNGLTLFEFVTALRLDKEKAASFKYLTKGYEVHHKDGNELNDALENLEVLTIAEHKTRHQIAVNKITTSVIKSIEYAGEEEVYDLAMEGPWHNFVANGFIAHNCDMYGGCAFRGICAKSPSSRQTWLKSDFKRRVWDPLQVRGDI